MKQLVPSARTIFFFANEKETQKREVPKRAQPASYRDRNETSLGKRQKVPSPCRKRQGKETLLGQFGQNIFAGSKKLKAVLSRGDVKQGQIDEQINQQRTTDSSSSQARASETTFDKSAHRSKRYKSNPVNLKPTSVPGASNAKRKADCLGVTVSQSSCSE